MRFLLKPFHGETIPAGMTIGGSIARRGDTLSLRYEARGDLSKVSIPGADGAARRVDRLWEGTCFELFLGVQGADGYWEVNLSPSGDWNVYHFTSYRTGMREETAFSSLPFRVRVEPGALRLSLDLDLGAILPPDRALDAGVCAVLRTSAGKVSHWALAHPGPRPDFHRRDEFASILPGEARRTK